MTRLLVRENHSQPLCGYDKDPRNDLKATDGGYGFCFRYAINAFFDCLPAASISASVRRRSGAS